MQYDIRGPNSRNLYYTRLKDGRIKTAATKELLVQKLDKMWILPNKQNKDSMSIGCLLYTSPSPRDRQKSRMPSSA